MERQQTTADLCQKEYHIYCIECIDTKKKYIEQTTNVHKRIASNKTNPLTKMAMDVHRYKPFNKHFIVDTIATTNSMSKVNTLKGKYIHDFDTTCADNGYNNLQTNLGSSKK